ncbi:hypothetical protein Daesc_004636 [Daldinia eschscholtzii]|uniref:Uncharacterized protein n=1 Tax=Daldinia eschscholtzii TaxID=292717 RepID=A0AAX6MPX1_9PEZI
MELSAAMSKNCGVEFVAQGIIIHITPASSPPPSTPGDSADDGSKELDMESNEELEDLQHQEPEQMLEEQVPLQEAASTALKFLEEPEPNPENHEALRLLGSENKELEEA